MHSRLEGRQLILAGPCSVQPQGRMKRRRADAEKDDKDERGRTRASKTDEDERDEQNEQGWTSNEEEARREKHNGKEQGARGSCEPASVCLLIAI